MFNISSNPAESMNKKLKLSCTKSTITFHRTCRILSEFKTVFLADFETHVQGDKLYRRKSSTVLRESMLLDIVHEYEHLVDTNLLLEPDFDSIITFCLRLGSVGKPTTLHVPDVAV